jgi:8-oxo-dGTP pyrophosphatase MutT (NUDIX family)
MSVYVENEGQYRLTRNTESLIHHKPIHAVGAVAYRYDARNRLQILLIKKRRGYWTLPKGKVAPTEDDASALLRELCEETDLTGVVEDQVRRSCISRHDDGCHGVKL